MSQEIVPNSKPEKGLRGGVERWSKGRIGPNKVTREARELADNLMRRPAYMRRFLKAWDKRELHPLLERRIWEYRFGPPKDPGGDPETDMGRTLAELLGPDLLKAALRASLAGGNGHGVTVTPSNGSNGDGVTRHGGNGDGSHEG